MTKRQKGRQVSSAPARTPRIPAPAPPAAEHVRYGYYRSSDNPGPCPACGGKLRRESQTYLIGTRKGKTLLDSFMLGCSGQVCSRCAALVIDPEEISKVLQFQRADWKVGNEFAVLGLIDLEAIPEDKQHLPPGDDDNPLPLIEIVFPEQR